MFGSKLSCLLNRHRPVRESVEWSGVAFVGTCKHCGAPIRRKGGGGWRRRSGEETHIFRNV